ncbi:MAG: DEAD/DEAH box helicase, partial [Deltaproteobacteria bacterium]|nr:DEAD/DEAH box helicase [Deltaproteobacteria bacterium]
MDFSPATRAWFEEAFAEPTEVQRRGWASIASGNSSLLIAPTGSGKTLAAFLWSIDRLASQPRDSEGVRVLYISPLKALAYDVDRNLRVPITGIARKAEALGIDVHLPRVAVRTGDTSPKARRQQAKHPAEILVTTPESLYLILGSQARATLRTVEHVIIDEVHALAPTKRGAHLSLSLERLARLTESDPQRIGLSATARPPGTIARYLGGDRKVTVVDTSMTPNIDLEIVVPVEDMTRPDQTPVARVEQPQIDGDDDEIFEDTAAPGESLLLSPPSDTRPGEHGLWPAIHPRLIELIRCHQTTIVFVNSRGLCERLVHRLNDLAGEPLVRAHHGSLSQRERRTIEEQLKAGEIPCIVATSSLELGIDMGAVDLVIMVESPGSIASGLQRIGRAGHQVGQRSKGRLFPKHRGDLLEATVVARRMSEGAIEAIRVPQNALDVLAQQVVAMVATASAEPGDDLEVGEIETLVGRSASYAELPASALHAVLDMLSGHYPSTAFADLRPRIIWDRDKDTLSARRGAKMISLVNGGTIPDRGMYGVYLGDGGPRVGELDEEMVHETSAGQTFTLGASTWRVEQITRDRVVVSPAPGEQGKLPFWRGDGPGRPIELGRAVGAFTREIAELMPEQAVRVLMDDYHSTEWAAQNLVAYLGEQREQTGTVPSDKAITIERFRDELGDWRMCILSPFGARVHAPWALALEARLTELTGFEFHTMWSDDGIVLRFADSDELPDEDLLIPEPELVEDLLLGQLAQSALFAGQFRENASRSLLMPRRRPDSRTPLWLQRLKSQQLLTVAREYPSFPVIMETYRSCLQDVFDVPALVELLGALRRREVRVETVETSGPSPFSRSLVF